MPADASAAEVVLSCQRRIGLRVALAVAAGLAFNLATGAVIPFFGPLIAVQFLIFGAGPLPLSKAVARNELAAGPRFKTSAKWSGRSEYR